MALIGVRTHALSHTPHYSCTIFTPSRIFFPSSHAKFKHTHTRKTRTTPQPSLRTYAHQQNTCERVMCASERKTFHQATLPRNPRSISLFHSHVLSMLPESTARMTPRGGSNPVIDKADMCVTNGSHLDSCNMANQGQIKSTYECCFFPTPHGNFRPLKNTLRNVSLATSINDPANY